MSVGLLTLLIMEESFTIMFQYKNCCYKSTLSQTRIPSPCCCNCSFRDVRQVENISEHSCIDHTLWSLIQEPEPGTKNINFLEILCAKYRKGVNIYSLHGGKKPAANSTSQLCFILISQNVQVSKIMANVFTAICQTNVFSS